MPLGLSQNLFQRIVSAVLLLPFVLGPLWAGGWWFSGFLLLGGALMAREWAQLTIGQGAVWSLLIGLPTLGMLSGLQAGQLPLSVCVAVLALTLVIGWVCVRLAKLPSAGWALVGIAYVGAPLIAMWWLRTLDNGLIVLWIFFVVWATDIGGYFFGKGIGGPKLAPRVSPKKTWAGLIGGMLFSLVVGLVLHFGFGLQESALVVAVSSAGLAAWAQVGDLVESGVKRHFNVKDSGELIPGHGGLLDRVDGLVFAAPAAAFLFAWLPAYFTVG